MEDDVFSTKFLRRRAYAAIEKYTHRRLGNVQFDYIFDGSPGPFTNRVRIFAGGKTYTRHVKW